MTTIQGTTADETLTGTSSDDTIIGGGGQDSIQGGAGNDEIRIESISSIDGGGGEDRLVLLPPPGPFAFYGFSTLNSIERMDFESQSGGNLVALLGLGGSELGNQVADSGLATIAGGEGQDILVLRVLGGGSFTLPHLNKVDWTTSGGPQALTSDRVTLNMGSPQDPVSYQLHASDNGSGTHTGVDSLQAGSGNDTLIGNNGIDILNGGTGVNALYAGGGDDLLIANGNVETPNGPLGGLFVTVAPSIYDGGEGFDHLVVTTTLAIFNSEASFVSIEGVHFAPATGSATLLISSAAAATLPANLLLSGTGTLQVGVEAGTAFDASAYVLASGADIDIRLSGKEDGSERIVGTAFDDSLLGNDGHDDLLGGNGADELSGGPGNDHLYGQSANGGADASDTLAGGDGSDYLQGNAGNDMLDGGEGSDRINGGQNDDVIQGGNGNDSVNGNRGNDNIQGGAGNDLLRGGQDNDSIDGGDGNDVLLGDLGVDTLTGGAGTDFFQFGGSSALFAGAAPDVVTDFEDGIDKLFVGYSVQSVLTGAAQFSFSAAASAAQQLFDDHAGGGEVALVSVGSDAYLFYSSNNGSSADSAVQLIGVPMAAITIADVI